MDSGKLRLDTLHIPYDKTLYKFDCIWQVKIPTRVKREGLKSYVKITSMDLQDGKCMFRSATVNNWYTPFLILKYLTP